MKAQPPIVVNLYASGNIEVLLPQSYRRYDDIHWTPIIKDRSSRDKETDEFRRDMEIRSGERV